MDRHVPIPGRTSIRGFAICRQRAGQCRCTAFAGSPISPKWSTVTALACRSPLRHKYFDFGNPTYTGERPPDVQNPQLPPPCLKIRSALQYVMYCTQGCPSFVPPMYLLLKFQNFCKLYIYFLEPLPLLIRQIFIQSSVDVAMDLSSIYFGCISCMCNVYALDNYSSIHLTLHITSWSEQLLGREETLTIYIILPRASVSVIFS
jgi:hypothetical protein